MSGKRKWRWMLMPVIEPLNVIDVWEHTPLDYYRYGEYPRFIRPPGCREPKVRWELCEVDR